MSLQCHCAEDTGGNGNSRQKEPGHQVAIHAVVRPMEKQQKERIDCGCHSAVEQMCQDSNGESLPRQEHAWMAVM